NSVNQISIVSSSSDLYFYVNSGERLRITSTGNEGIGTSSPSSKLHLSGAATVDAKLTLTQTTAGLTGTLQQGATSLTLSASGAQAITLDTNGAERLRIDSSGNLGLGVTPSAWAGLVGFQIGQAASFAGHKTLPVAYSTANAYYDGGAWRYITSSYAVSAVVDANNGSFYWRTAPSGTAGDPITLTQAMTLDASGRLGIGTSSPGHPLTVNANPGAAGVPVAWLHNSGNVADYDGVVISSVNDGSDAEVLHVRTNNTTYNNGTSLMLVRGDGNVGIGTSSPANPLTVGGSIRGTVLINGTNGASPYLALDHTATTNGRRYIIYSGGINASEFNIYDATASTNRVTLDAAGNLGLGVTPSAWTNSFGVIQGLGGWSVSSNGVNSNSADFASNAYRTGGVDSFVYIGTSNATRYKQFAGAHQWFNAPSGTAGTAITFTQAMTLTAGGDLLVGKTTLDVGISGIEAQSDGSLYVTKNISSGGQVAIFNRLTSDGTIVSLRKDGTTVGSIGTEGGDLIIGTGDTGVQFGDGGDYIRPWNTSTNANRDA
ncbi:MAG TPA: hypothetical protein VLA24_09880, partial [Pseudomonadales bacterium]|nr:hypothetical protein [Pseudomonadales bacterium]